MEVGSTNRTRIGDYARALEAGDIRVVLKVHRSNFRITGFTEETSLEELAALTAGYDVPLLHDLGSGLLMEAERLGLPGEPRPHDSLGAGSDLVAFSGDKLLGGPQAGILLGRTDLIARLRGDPMCRALRVDKATLAGLEATLRLYRDPERALREIPTLRMLACDAAEFRLRADSVASRLRRPVRRRASSSRWGRWGRHVPRGRAAVRGGRVGGRRGRGASSVPQGR